MTLGVANAEGDMVILDVVKRRGPPIQPRPGGAGVLPGAQGIQLL